MDRARTVELSSRRLLSSTEPRHSGVAEAAHQRPRRHTAVARLVSCSACAVFAVLLLASLFPRTASPPSADAPHSTGTSPETGPTEPSVQRWARSRLPLLPPVEGDEDALRNAAVVNDPDRLPTVVLRRTARLSAMAPDARLSDAAGGSNKCAADAVFARDQRQRRHQISEQVRTGGDGAFGGRTLRVAVLTFADTAPDAADFRHPARIASIAQTQWNHRQYALQHGYDLLWEDSTLAKVDANRTLHWAKLVNLARWVPHYDWILWADADTLFYNFSITVEAILATYASEWWLHQPRPPPARPAASQQREDESSGGRRTAAGRGGDGRPRLFLARDVGGSQLNTGVMLVRGRDESVLEFLSMVYHYPNATVEPGHTLRRWEQGPFNAVLQPPGPTTTARRRLLHNYTVASGWAALLPSRLLNARPSPWWPVPSLAVASPRDTLLLHFACLWCGVPLHGKHFFGAMGFSRAYELAAAGYEGEAAAAVEPGCVFHSAYHDFIAAGGEVTPAGVVARSALKATVGLPLPPPHLVEALRQIEQARLLGH